ncbi:hypothetical protein K0M31_020026 [Melipona bicolor]|uniref:Uncharacterized protein n=1 Tax=Melipona bicolor TaxID=60889 RepID=A0AA40G0U3_9HYME|nr:hypothetical protein K0M31_020026 [Melipona bicolor]
MLATAFKRLAAYNGCRNVDRKGCQLGGRKTNASSEASGRAPAGRASVFKREMQRAGSTRRTERIRGPRLEHNQQHLRAGKAISRRVVPSGTERNGEREGRRNAESRAVTSAAMSQPDRAALAADRPQLTLLQPAARR